MCHRQSVYVTGSLSLRDINFVSHHNDRNDHFVDPYWAPSRNTYPPVNRPAKNIFFLKDPGLGRNQFTQEKHVN